MAIASKQEGSEIEGTGSVYSIEDDEIWLGAIGPKQSGPFTWLYQPNRAQIHLPLIPGTPTNPST
jgi:hypothetical protein